MTHQPFMRLSLTDAELEAHIVDCGQEFLKAHAAGNMELARHWLLRQTQAVDSRSPQQVERMERCYFCEQGDLSRAWSMVA